jgi:hypothetical protein
MRKSVKGTMILLLLFERCFANPEADGKAFAEMLQQRPLLEQQSTLEDLRRQSDSSTLETQTSTLERLFESQFDVGKKGEDPLKSSLATQTLEASQRQPANQPRLGDAEHLLKQKHRFKISPEDTVFKKQQAISKADFEDGAGLFQKGQPVEAPLPVLQEKILTCRQSAKPEPRTCIKRLVITAAPQASLVKTVTAHFTARCYNLVTFSINLKTGQIGVHQCENQGPVSVYVTNPIGEPELPAQTTIALISKQHFGEGGVDFRTGQMSPSVANGFTASFTAFQPNTGRKKSHENNKNNVRGGQYSWQVTLPSRPILQERWEGCEDLERQSEEGFCEMVASESQGVNETRGIPGYPTPITREHWSLNKSFVCGAGRDIDECQTLVEQKCEQINSQCVQTKEGFCIEYENTFRCGVPDYLKGEGLTFNSGEVRFLKGHAQQYPSYNSANFSEAVTHFSALTEMSKKLSDELGGIMGNPDNPEVFRGKCSQCRVNLGSFFRDCCKLKGILRGLFGQCHEEEKKLAIAHIRNQRCVKVEGRYCHKKKAGICIEKRDSYCCYGSKLSRIVQEIAHEQLNIPWGGAEEPNCSGVTSEQLSRVDFTTPRAQQKLAEIMAEVQASAEEKFERVQNAVARIGNVEDKVKALELKQGEALYKKFTAEGESITINENPHYQAFKDRQEEERLTVASTEEAQRQKALAVQYWAEKEALLKKVSEAAGYPDFEALIKQYMSGNKEALLNEPSYIFEGKGVYPQTTLRHSAIDIGILNFPQAHQEARAIHEKYLRGAHAK